MKISGRKKLGIILGIVVVVLVILGMVVPKLLDLNRYHGFIVSEVEKAVGGKVNLGRISWGIAHRIWLEIDGFSIIDASAFPGDVSLTRIHTSVSILPLLTKKVKVKNLQLEGAEVKFRLEPAAKKTDTPAAGVHLPVEIEIQQLAVAIKRLELDDALSLPGQTLVHVFSDVDLAATNIAPAEVMAFNVSFRDKSPSGLGTLKAQGTFSGLTTALTLENPDLKLKAALNTLHVDAVNPYLKNSRLKNHLTGSISMEVNYEGDLAKKSRAQGVIDLSQLTYSNPSLWEAALPGQKTTIAFQVKLDPQDFTAEKIALKLGNLSLDAGAVLQSWSKDPMIKNAEFSADMSLVDLIPLIPWKQLGDNATVIRPILEGGGKIALNKVVLPEISLSKLPATVNDLLPEIEMTAQVAGVSVQPSPKIPNIENIVGTVHLANGIAQVQGLTAQIASVDLPLVSAKITNLMEKPKIDATINGRLKLDAIADEKFQKLLEEVGLEKVIGSADLDLVVGLETARPADFQLQGNIGLKDFQVKTAYSPALLQGLIADVAIKPTAVNLSRASANAVLPASATSPGGQFTLELQGRVDDWRSKPSVTLQNVRTSQISLPLLASMIPWEKLGQSAKPVKEILDAGGFIAIEALSLPAIDLSKLPKDPKHVLPRVKLATSLTDITVPRGLSPAKIEGITGRVNLAQNVLVAENVHARLGPIALPTLNIRATDIADHFKIALRAKGPLRVAAAGDAEIQKLLMEHGLKSLTGPAEMDMRVDYDQRWSKDWIADGSLVLAGVQAETHPLGVIVDNLQGRVTLSRRKAIDVTLQEITAQVNQAPIQVSGKLQQLGTPKFLVDVKAYAKQLELAHLGEFLPALKKIGLAGKLDMDLGVYIPYAAPTKSRMNGWIAAENLNFQIAAYDVKNVDTKVTLAGNAAEINQLHILANDQLLAATGRIANPVEPNIQLTVTSSDLNIGRLLPTAKAKKRESEPLQNERSEIKKKSKKAELAPFARKLVADLQLQADRGQYKGLQFEKLNLKLLYKRGVIESYDVNFGIDKGHIATKGSADLRELDRIRFTVDPHINALPLERIAQVFGIDKLPLNGPLTLRGQLRGRTGSTRELLASLDGNLNAKIGPGNLSRVGKVGDLFAKLFTLKSIQGIFSGRLFRDLSDRGVFFETIKAQTSFTRGRLNLNKLHFGSDVMHINGHGAIDLVDQRLNISALLEPLATVDKALNYIPLVGKAVDDITKIRIDMEGPLEDPKIRSEEARELGTGIETELKEPETILKDVGKDLKNVF